MTADFRCDSAAIGREKVAGDRAPGGSRKTKKNSAWVLLDETGIGHKNNRFEQHQKKHEHSDTSVYPAREN